ncbi:MAG: cytochrome P450 [Streptosporangiales bacterium]|jgi:cytochrome P450|nr:cytochrome P450 [Streptosporangiales bacterium]
MSAGPEAVRFPFPASPVPYDPGPEAREEAAKCPVTRVRLPDGSAAWLATGFRETREVMTDPRYSRALVYTSGRELHGLELVAAGSILAEDPPEHSRLRKLVAGAFTARRMEALRAEIARVVDDLIGDLRAGPRPADLVRAFSLMLPANVICLLLGVPVADTDRFHQWSSVMFGDWRRTPEELAGAYAAMSGYIAELIARKREEPADDLISVLVDARDSGGKLSEDELVNFCVNLLAAGYETTANMISLSLMALHENPGELARLREDPGLIPRAVEELLRYVVLEESGTDWMSRLTREEVCLGGVTIPAGEAVIPAFNYANRDPAEFEDPDRLDVGREPRTHLAFGAGPHHCVGAQLARIELQEAFRGLLRLPGLRLAVPVPELEFREAHAVTSVRELPVTWDDP